MLQHIHIAETDSTNSELRRLMNHEQIENLFMLTAGFQTAGRGQVGNKWESNRDENLLMSIIMRPKQLDVRQQYLLSMAISSAVARAVRHIVDNVRMKWPNDVYVDNKKLGGILIENTLRGTLIADSIMGLGLNVNQTLFVSDAPNPISLQMLTNKSHSIQSLAQSIQQEMAIALNLVDNEQFDTIHDEYISLLYRADGNMYLYADANGTFEARIVGVEPDGHLILADKHNKIRRYAFKEVEFII